MKKFFFVFVFLMPIFSCAMQSDKKLADGFTQNQDFADKISTSPRRVDPVLSRVRTQSEERLRMVNEGKGLVPTRTKKLDEK